MGPLCGLCDGESRVPATQVSDEPLVHE
jgi:hypothetical protein